MSSDLSCNAPRPAIEAALRSAGIEIFGFVGEAAYREACSGMPEETRARYGGDRVRSACAAALPFGEGPAEAPLWARDLRGPMARIARFARSDWYAELSSRLRTAGALARAALADAGIDPGPSRDWRHVANSGLPERRLAALAGLGAIGRHGLVMVEGHGSAVVLGLLLLPLPVDDAGTTSKGDEYVPATGGELPLSPSCERCGACVAACPTGALGGHGAFRRELCLQHWSSIPGPLPPIVEAAWGDRLYGCDSCQEACPLFSPDPGARTDRGPLGRGLPAAYVAAASPEELRARLRRSALGLGWISPSALARNAALVLRGR